MRNCSSNDTCFLVLQTAETGETQTLNSITIMKELRLTMLILYREAHLLTNLLDDLTIEHASQALAMMPSKVPRKTPTLLMVNKGFIQSPVYRKH